MGRGRLQTHAVLFAAVTEPALASGSVPVTQRKSTGATAANRSAAWQASL